MKAKTLAVAALVAAGAFTTYGLAQTAPSAPSAPDVTVTVPADAVPYRAPGATITGLRKGGTTYYDGGNLIVTQAAAVAYPWECQSGYFCLFSLNSGTGDRYSTSVAGSYVNLANVGFNDVANSWRNRRSTGTYIDESTTGAGWRICANPGQANIPVGSQNEASRVFNRLSGLC